MTTNTLMKRVRISIYYNNAYSSSHTPPTIYEYNKGQSIECSRSKHHKSITWTSSERKFQEAKIPGSEYSSEWKFQEAKVPRSESSGEQIG